MLICDVDHNPNTAVITALLKAGADAKAKSSSGKTALDYAQDNDKIRGTDAYRQLQEAQEGSQLAAASIGAQTNDFFELVKTATPQDIQAAIYEGARVNAQNTYVETPLMLAIMHNPKPEVITTLLKVGADAKIKDKSGKTALDCAQANENLKGTDALKQLEEASK